MEALSRLEISLDHYREMVAQLKAVQPLEGCGLIATDGVRAMKLYAGTNIDRSATRFTMDPAEVLAALTEIRQCGWELGAIYHSHPHSAAEPSQTDLQHAYYPDALMVIVSLAAENVDARAFRIDGEVRQVPIVVRP